MKTATGLAVVAVGAILAFAVTARLSFFNLQVAGWILILVGVAGMVVPRRSYGWLRRRLVLSPNRPGSRVVVTPSGEPVRIATDPRLRPADPAWQGPEEGATREIIEEFREDAGR